ncbi:MAG: hypothetical protein EOO40_00065 [Deltaproteobacteria bacterium]|nr:MAG: hypothetical protein EOO40_00065 [Deltaproteobacteria bacterium]
MRKARAAMPAPQGSYAVQRLMGTQSIVRRLASQKPEMPPAGLEARLDGLDTTATRLDQITYGIFADAVTADVLTRRIAELRVVTQNEVDFRQAVWSLLRVESVPQDARPIIMRRAMQWYKARVIAKDPRNNKTAKRTSWARS